MYFFAINARWYNGCLNSFGVIVSSEPVFSSVQQYLLGTAQRTELPLSGGYRLQDIRIDPCVLAVDLGLYALHTISWVRTSQLGVQSSQCQVRVCTQLEKGHWETVRRPRSLHHLGPKIYTLSLLTSQPEWYHRHCFISSDFLLRKLDSVVLKSPKSHCSSFMLFLIYL